MTVSKSCVCVYVFHVRAFFFCSITFDTVHIIISNLHWYTNIVTLLYRGIPWIYTELQKYAVPKTICEVENTDYTVYLRKLGSYWAIPYSHRASQVPSTEKYMKSTEQITNPRNLGTHETSDFR